MPNLGLRLGLGASLVGSGKGVPGVLRGAVSGLASLSGALSLGLVGGTINGAGTLTGAISASASLSGQINGVTTLTGALVGSGSTPTYYLLGF